MLPTVLDHLELPVPEHVHGRLMTVDTSKGHDVGYVRRLDRRLRVVFPRRFPAMRALVASLALVGARRPSAQAPPGDHARRARWRCSGCR